MMCNHSILYANQCGFVRQCRKCRNVQLAYGTCVLHLSEQEYRNFLVQVSELVVAGSAKGNPARKQFIYSTDSGKVKLIFSFAELEKLYHLMTSACLRLHMNQISCN